VVPGLEQPIGARPLWPGTFYLDVDSIDGIVAFTGAGSRIWLVDKSGSVVALDLRTGGRTTLARLPSKPRRAYMSVSAGFVYIVDTEAQLLESVDVVLGTVRSRSMPFGSSIVGMDVAWDGRLWFASSAVGQLISFDPSADRFGSVNRYAAGRISAIYARSPNKIWFAYPRGKDAIVGSYDTRWGVVDERRIADAGEVSALQVDESETVWLASSSLGLLSLRGEQLTPSTAGAASYAAFASAADGTVLSLIVDNRGAGTMQTVERVTMPFPAAARGLFVDNSGRIWSANTANHGFYIVVRVIAP
jgi:streptogramin lyase